MPRLTLKLLIARLWFYFSLRSDYIVEPLPEGIESILSKDLGFWYLTASILTIYMMIKGF